MATFFSEAHPTSTQSSDKPGDSTFYPKSEPLTTKGQHVFLSDRRFYPKREPGDRVKRARGQQNNIPHK
eukprot:4958827-Heterocapsa_arctica.AAC.1